MKAKIKLNLPAAIPAKIDQAKKVVTMSKEVMTGEQPLIDALLTTNTILATKQDEAMAARQASVQATAALKAASTDQTNAYSTLADHVSVLADGDATLLHPQHRLRRSQ